MKDILATITKYREERDWTEYQLAERPGLTQYTISSWYRKNLIPTIPSLKKNLQCIWHHIVSAFCGRKYCRFSYRFPEEASGPLNRLSEEQQNAVFLLIDKM